MHFSKLLCLKNINCNLIGAYCLAQLEGHDMVQHLFYIKYATILLQSIDEYNQSYGRISSWSSKNIKFHECDVKFIISHSWNYDLFNEGGIDALPTTHCQYVLREFEKLLEQSEMVSLLHLKIELPAYTMSIFFSETCKTTGTKWNCLSDFPLHFNKRNFTTNSSIHLNWSAYKMFHTLFVQLPFNRGQVVSITATKMLLFAQYKIIILK